MPYRKVWRISVRRLISGRVTRIAGSVVEILLIVYLKRLPTLRAGKTVLRLKGANKDMELELRINGMIKSLEVAPNEALMTVLRQEGYFGVKHGCEKGERGAYTALFDAVPRPSRFIPPPTPG